MRIRGHVIGARATVATRRSVILSADGFELVLVFCGSASSVWSAQKPAPSRPAVDCRNERLLDVFTSASPLNQMPLSTPNPHPDSGSVPSFRPDGGEVEPGVT